ncbi:MAG: serine/threonine protein kinase [Anaerolineae bacterium]|nr:serine/threonine protein kinase [Anaerolineae bacterium]
MAEVLASIGPGEIIGPYRVVRSLPDPGGMARIFEAEVRRKYDRDRSPGMPRRVALKVAGVQHQSALVTEADYLRRFRHPNVVRIFPLPGHHKPIYAAKEAFSFGWHWYYAMELVAGGALEGRLTRSETVRELLHRKAMPPAVRPLPIVAVIGIARQLAAALEHIHQHSVLNLDVKPSNILIRSRRFRGLCTAPRVVLSDFGIARDPRYPRFGVLGVATPEYVSPEHARELTGQSARLDSRSDLFSLGVVLYEMLTGQLPFEDIGLTLDPHFAPVPLRALRPRIPEALAAVVMRLLEKDPARRYPSAGDLGVALANVRGARRRKTTLHRPSQITLPPGG